MKYKVLIGRQASFENEFNNLWSSSWNRNSVNIYCLMFVIKSDFTIVVQNNYSAWIIIDAYTCTFSCHNIKHIFNKLCQDMTVIQQAVEWAVLAVSLKVWRIYKDMRIILIENKRSNVFEKTELADNFLSRWAFGGWLSATFLKYTTSKV